jgi:hypothetical protein
MSISIFRDISRERMIEAEHERVVRELEGEKRRLELLVHDLQASAGSAGAREGDDR